MTVRYKDYEKALKDFYTKHTKGDSYVDVFTSPLEGNRYRKEYVSTDGGIFFEINEKISEVVDVVAHGIIVPVTVDLLRTEFFSTDNSKSAFVYQKY